MLRHMCVVRTVEPDSTHKLDVNGDLSRAYPGKGNTTKRFEGGDRRAESMRTYKRVIPITYQKSC